jgi:hypothetical protein
MKKIYFGIILSGLLAIITLFSCTRNDCGGTLCFTPPAPVVIELRDSQDRDLLNPATPGHYDTLEIKRLNDNRVFIIPPAANYYLGNKDRYKLLLSNSNANSIQLSLGNGVTDNVFTRFEKKTKDCCTYYELSAFTYNGVQYPETFKQYYLIKKMMVK